MTKTLGIIGGDKRFLFTAKAFADDNWKVKLFGFTKISADDYEVCNSLEEIKYCDLLVFPVPPVKDGVVNAPFAKNPIAFNKELADSLKGKKVFLPMKEKVVSIYNDFKKVDCKDYFKREDFTLLNAYITAEGALQVLLNSFEGSVLDSRILICGFGRIGKCLAKILKDLNADVTVSARKSEDFAKITINGYKPLHTEQIKEVKDFDVVFNTVPSLIFTKEVLKNTHKNTLFIDLASLPGGIDKASAKEYNIDVIHALALPGITAPKKAGEIIKDTIVKMLKEDNG